MCNLSITKSLITYQQSENLEYKKKPPTPLSIPQFPSILLSTKLKIISQTPSYFSTLNQGIICLPIYLIVILPKRIWVNDIITSAKIFTKEKGDKSQGQFKNYTRFGLVWICTFLAWIMYWNDIQMKNYFTIWCLIKIYS